MNPQNKASALEFVSKLEELYVELTDLLVDKCNSELEVSNFFIREMPPVIGPMLVELQDFIDSFKVAGSPASPNNGPKAPKTKNSKN